jgi:hypothetical protein
MAKRLPFACFIDLKWLRVELKRHEITDTPKILHVDTRSVPADGLDKSTTHDLHIPADQRLQIGRAGVEQYEQDIEPLILEKSFRFGHVHGQKCHVDGRKTDDYFGRANPGNQAGQE